jgi:upstream activation factor subunit UAF30
MSSPKKTGLMAPLKVSAELAKIIGTKEDELVSRPQVPRAPLLTTPLPQVTKKLWAYLKEKNLQDPENKQWFTPDDTMAGIFGTERIKCFSMAKYLKEHLTKPE